MITKLTTNESKKNINSETCHICLGNLKKDNHIDCFPKGSIIIKKKDHALVTVSKAEPIIKRMLNISKNKNDKSEEYILLYVNKKFAGYKTPNQTWFTSEFLNDKFRKILVEYIPKSDRKYHF